MTSSDQFRSRVNAVKARMRETVRHKIVAYGTVLHQALVNETPILTGQARANWQAVIGSPGGQFIGLGGPTTDPRDLAHGRPSVVSYGAYAEQARAVIESYQPGQSLYIFSNLPYIVRLNDGYSQQAPAGFAESAVLQAKSAVRG